MQSSCVTAKHYNRSVTDFLAVGSFYHAKDHSVVHHLFQMQTEYI